MSSFYTNSTKEKINLASKPLAEGGEGKLFAIRTPKRYQTSLAKIYHPNKLDEGRIKKISYLLEHPIEQEERPFFVWPQQLLSDKEGKGRGFLMPLVEGKKLALFCLPKLPKSLATNWAQYDFSHKKGRENRLKVAYQLAYALYLLQRGGEYVLVDFKPENILLHENGQISIVDIDSIQILENGELKFRAPVATPEFSAPEYYRGKIEQFSASWDNFALAVIIYKLLLGVHPYAATAKQKNLSSLHQNIERGLFVHHPQAETLFEVRPSLHQAYYELPEKLQALFQTAFVAGHERAELRPRPEDFCLVIAEELEDKSFYRQFLQKDLEGKLAKASLEKVVMALEQSPIPEKILGQKVIPAQFAEICQWELPEALNPQQDIWVKLEQKAYDLRHKNKLAPRLLLLAALLSFILPPCVFLYITSQREGISSSVALLLMLWFLLGFPLIFIRFAMGNRKEELEAIDLVQDEMIKQRERYLAYWRFAKETIQPLWQSMRLSLSNEIDDLRSKWTKETNTIKEQLSALLDEEEKSWRVSEKQILPKLAEIHPLLQNVSSIAEAEKRLQEAEENALAKLQTQTFEQANSLEELSASAFKKTAKKLEEAVQQVQENARNERSKLSHRKNKQLASLNDQLEKLGDISAFLVQELNWPQAVVQAFLNELQPFGLDYINLWQAIDAKQAALIGKSEVVVDLAPFIQKDSDYQAFQKRLFKFRKIQKEFKQSERELEDQFVLDQIAIAKKEKEEIAALKDKQKKLALLGPEARRKQAIEQSKAEFNQYYTAFLKQKYAVSQQLLQKREAQQKDYQALAQSVERTQKDIALAYAQLLKEQKLANEMILEGYREKIAFWDNPQLNNFEHLMNKAEELRY
ncbi:hypothetical protein PPO43_15590 [Saprospira sp. CCB-QB6]|uniref:protein kinase domain-containing protein n=1 Tax=Saprospira sp. CCB-QB6 TaxID=3023936 RepID=UPI00234AD255|nr:hypothetical protein [Saprospira sp. CCB-QB6]WCL81398.1 hypothetical protein PPO43_15590 [Saprospira sp. CCB-QB6]